jgi:hypothetical protein
MTTERPILFSDPMVRAILSGAKTQTRRLVRFPAEVEVDGLTRMQPGYPDGPRPIWDYDGEPNAFSTHNPYGGPGDRLYVREAWRTFERPEDLVDGIRFRADDAFRPIENSREAADRWVGAHNNGIHGDRWRPSIHMPWWASRLTLEVTGIRVERLQDITEEDARWEGVGLVLADSFPVAERKRITDFVRDGDRRGAFALLWDSINARRAPWDSNPWVWVVGFRRVE